MFRIKSAAARAPVATTFSIIWGALLGASIFGLVLARGDASALALHGLFFIFSAYKLSKNAAIVLDRRDYSKREMTPTSTLS